MGLVLEGGGTRAVYTSGVLDFFLDKDLTFDYIIGVSAGSCNGTSFLAKNRGRQHDLTVKYVHDKRYMGIKPLKESGNFLNIPWIFGELAYETMPLDFDTFERADTRLVAVVTNALTGLPEYHDVENLREECSILAASCAMPLATKGVTVNGMMCYDGGITDSIPLEHALADGCDRAVVILTQHKGYQKKPLGPRSEKVLQKMLGQYPVLAQKVRDRYMMYNRQLEYTYEKERQAQAFVIQPSQPLECSSLERNVQKLEWVYQLGYSDAKASLENLLRFMNG